MHMFQSGTYLQILLITINKYIDDTTNTFRDENYGKVKGNAELEHSYSKGLVGQIRQDERICTTRL